MPSAGKLSLDLLFAVLCALTSPVQKGNVYTVMVTDQGVIDAGTIEVSGDTLAFFDGIGDRRSKVSLVRLGEQGSRYRYEHKVEPAREISIDELVLNRKDFDPKNAESFQFQIVDGSTVTLVRIRGEIYLHQDGTPNTIVLQR